VQSDHEDVERIKILIERTRELSIDIAVANEREFSKRFESSSPTFKVLNFLRVRVSRVPYLYRILLRFKGFFN
jgi:hypothetical protein